MRLIFSEIRRDSLRHGLKIHHLLAWSLIQGRVRERWEKERVRCSAFFWNDCFNPLFCLPFQTLNIHVSYHLSLSSSPSLQSFGWRRQVWGRWLWLPQGQRKSHERWLRVVERNCRKGRLISWTCAIVIPPFSPLQVPNISKYWDPGQVQESGHEMMHSFDDGSTKTSGSSKQYMFRWSKSQAKAKRRESPRERERPWRNRCSAKLSLTVRQLSQRNYQIIWATSRHTYIFACS